VPAACPDRRVISAVIRPGHNTRGHNYRQLANQDNHGNHIMRPGPYSSLQDGCTGLSRASGIYRTQPASRRPEKLCQVPWVRARVAGRLAATAHPVDASCMLCVVPPMAAILVANGARPPPAAARVSPTCLADSWACWLIMNGMYASEWAAGYRRRQRYPAAESRSSTTSFRYSYGIRVVHFDPVPDVFNRGE